MFYLLPIAAAAIGGVIYAACQEDEAAERARAESERQVRMQLELMARYLQEQSRLRGEAIAGASDMEHLHPDVRRRLRRLQQRER